MKKKNAANNSLNDACLTRASMSSAQEKRYDDAVIAFIRGLDFFIAQANGSGLGPAARILYTAKEDLVYWACKMGFYETKEERFINSHLYNNQSFAAADSVPQSETPCKKKMKKKILDGFERQDPAWLLIESMQKTSRVSA